MISKTFRPELRPFVDAIWQSKSGGLPSRWSHVRALPTGAIHIAFRLADNPRIRLFEDEEDKQGFDGGSAVVNGFRSKYYIRATAANCESVGVMLKPDALPKLFHCHANEFAAKHVRVDDIWPDAELIVERLTDATVETRLETLQQILVEKLSPMDETHPAVTFALAEINRGGKTIGDIVRKSGYSHRRLNELFRRSVGVNPKTFARTQQFRRFLLQLSGSTKPLSVLAVEAGYSDQAHMTREFRRYTGLSPSEYLRRNRRDAFTVPV